MASLFSTEDFGQLSTENKPNFASKQLAASTTTVTPPGSPLIAAESFKSSFHIPDFFEPRAPVVIVSEVAPGGSNSSSGSSSNPPLNQTEINAVNSALQFESSFTNK